MCNQYTNEHTFVYGTNTTSTQCNEPSPSLLCVCKKLTYKQAMDLALNALYRNEHRRQTERELEAKYWMDLE